MRMKVTFSDEEQAAIDALRGQMPAATWVRQLVRQAGVAGRVLAAEKAAAAESAREAIPPFVPGGRERPIIQKRA